MLTENVKKQIQLAMLTYMDEQQISARELHKVSKVNSSYINAIQKGLWNEYQMGDKTISIKDKWFEQIAFHIGHEYEVSYWQHFDTINYKLIVKACNRAKKNRSRVGIDGFTGSGKTHALDMYRRLNVNETYVIKCSGDMNPKDFMLAIAREIGVDTRGSRYVIRRAITSKLKSMHRPLLIIDEAENVKKEAVLDAIKGICDELEKQCGIVLCGMGIKEKWALQAEKKRYCYPQINRRFKGSWVILITLSEDDITFICRQVGITGQGAINYLNKNVHDYGHLSELVTAALREHHEFKTPINADLFKTIAA